MSTISHDAAALWADATNGGHVSTIAGQRFVGQITAALAAHHAGMAADADVTEALAPTGRSR